MKRTAISTVSLLLFLLCGLSLQAQQKWNTQNKGGAFLAKVDRALDLTESQLNFAKTALDESRPYTREEFRNMSAEVKKTTKESSRTIFFNRLNEVLTEAQKDKLTAFKNKIS